MWNQIQAENARDRIRLAVEALIANNELPDGLTARRDAVAKASGTSVKTCYKNRDLWDTETPKPAPSKEDHPISAESDDPRSPKPAPSMEDHPTVSNKLYLTPEQAPQALASGEFPEPAVGGSGGQEASPGPNMVLAVLKQIRAQKAKSAAIALDSTPPDECYFEQASQRCEHPRAHTGLDAHYCPDCRISIDYGTAGYERILQRSLAQQMAKRASTAPIHQPQRDAWRSPSAPRYEQTQAQIVHWNSTGTLSHNE